MGVFLNYDSFPSFWVYGRQFCTNCVDHHFKKWEIWDYLIVKINWYIFLALAWSRTKKGKYSIDMLHILQRGNFRLPRVRRSLYLNYLIFRYVVTLDWPLWSWLCISSIIMISWHDHLLYNICQLLVYIVH